VLYSVILGLLRNGVIASTADKPYKIYVARATGNEIFEFRGAPARRIFPQLLLQGRSGGKTEAVRKALMQDALFVKKYRPGRSPQRACLALFDETSP